jgi:indole-3-glycerol phosphate synthase
MKILREILSSRKKSLEEQKKIVPLVRLKGLLEKPLSAPRFAAVLASPGVHLIAELKKASPSAGLIRKDFDALTLAKSYAQGGASVLSVLTEERFFKGSISYLDKIRKNVSLPLLRKDFIIDAYQLYESKAHGADAVLLIAAILTKKEINDFIALCRRLKLDVVCEVHSQEEMKVACDSGAGIIGLNSRDLNDFSLDLKILPALLKKIPKNKLSILESGIKTLEDLAYVKNLKPNAVLIGEGLMRERDVASATRRFVVFLAK